MCSTDIYYGFRDFQGVVALLKPAMSVWPGAKKMRTLVSYNLPGKREKRNGTASENLWWLACSTCVKSFFLSAWARSDTGQVLELEVFQPVRQKLGKARAVSSLFFGHPFCFSKLPLLCVCVVFKGKPQRKNRHIGAP